MSLKLVATTKCKIKMTANGVESLPVELSNVMSFSGSLGANTFTATISVTEIKSNYSSVDGDFILINNIIFNISALTFNTYVYPTPTPVPVSVTINSTTTYSTDSGFGILRKDDSGLGTVSAQDPSTQTVLPISVSFEIVDAGQTNTTAE